MTIKKNLIETVIKIMYKKINIFNIQGQNLALPDLCNLLTNMLFVYLYLSFQYRPAIVNENQDSLIKYLLFR